MWKLKIKTDLMTDPFELYADDVDYMHLPLVMIKGIQREQRSSLIQLPDSEIYTEFSKFKTILIACHHVLWAGELKEEEKKIAELKLFKIEAVAQANQ